jgi:hypothetical protein
MIGTYEILMVILAVCDLVVAIIAIRVMKKGTAARSLRE